MFESIGAIGGIIGGFGVMALAALWIIVQRSPNGENKKRRDARSTIHNLETKMDSLDGKIDKLTDHIIDHLRDHAKNF